MKTFDNYFQIVLETTNTKYNVVELSIKIKETKRMHKQHAAVQAVLNKNLKVHAKELEALNSSDLRNQITKYLEEELIVTYKVSDATINSLNAEGEIINSARYYNSLDDVISYLKDNLALIVQLVPVCTIETRERAEEAIKEVEEQLQPFKKDSTKWFVHYDYRIPEQDISVSKNVIITTSQNELLIIGVLSDLYAVKKALQEPDQEDDISVW